MIEELTKLPTESDIYDMDFSKKLGTGETITSITSITFVNIGRLLGSADITLGTQAFSDSSIQVRISSGQQYEQYEVIGTVLTSLGNTKVGKGLLRVQ